MTLYYGTVYWFTGLPGAGKSTLGRLFHAELKKMQNCSVYLDGDELREILGFSQSGYSRDEREVLAFRYSSLCLMLVKQNIDVVIATVSLFHSVQSWNRENLLSYREIYVSTTHETLLKRNQKSLYSSAIQGLNSNVVGINQNYEVPKNPDITILNEGEHSPEQLVTKLTQQLLK